MQTPSLCALRRYPLLILIVIAMITMTRGQSTSEVKVGFTPTGPQRFSPGKWAAVAINGINPTNEDTEETVSLYLNDDPSLQFAKRLWVPAGARRTTWLPIMIPDTQTRNPARATVSMMRLKESQGIEEFTTNAFGTPITSRSLLLTTNEINTAVMIGRSSLQGDKLANSRVEQIYETIYAGRDAMVNSPLDLSLINLGVNFLPPTPHALDELDQVVIATDQILSDSSGVAQIRDWLHDGGRVWVMLDLVSEEVVRALIGDATRHTVVDKVALNEYELVTDDVVTSEEIREPWSAEIPVDMVRVLTDVDDVVATVDGWPAGFWQPVGRGELLITTLEARGWLKEGVPTRAYHGIAARLFDPRNDPVLHAESMIEMLDDQIGYEIPARSWAGMILGANLLVILVGGCWWLRQRRLERLALLIPVSTIVTTAILLQAGTQQVKSVPSTVASGQLVRVLDDVDQAQVSAVHAIYSQEASDLGLVCLPGNVTLPLPASGAGGIRRIRWDDSGRSRWQGSEQPPGVVRYAQSQSTIPLATPLIARGTFDDQGLQARIEGLQTSICEDGVVIARQRPSTATTTTTTTNETEGETDAALRLRATVDDLLAPDQFIAGALLSDQQRMRQQVLRTLFSSAGASPFGADPSILFWTEPLDSGVDFSESFRQAGSALVGVSVRIDRPASGTSYRVPATFVDIDTYIGSRGMSAVYDSRTGKWLTELTRPVEVELVCSLPDSLAPFRLDAINFAVKINAPGRSLVVKAKRNGEPVEVFRQDNPTGVIEFSVERSETLELTPEGAWWMAIAVTETEQERQRLSEPTEEAPESRITNQDSVSTWQIDYVHADAAATSL